MLYIDQDFLIPSLPRLRAWWLHQKLSCGLSEESTRWILPQVKGFACSPHPCRTWTFCIETGCTRSKRDRSWYFKQPDCRGHQSFKRDGLGKRIARMVLHVHYRSSVKVRSRNRRTNQTKEQLFWLCHCIASVAVVGVSLLQMLITVHQVSCEISNEGDRSSVKTARSVCECSLLLPTSSESPGSWDWKSHSEIQSQMGHGRIWWPLSNARWGNIPRISCVLNELAVDQLVVDGGFELVEQFSYDHQQFFSHEAWRGRIRTCNGVGSGTLSEEQTKQFDQNSPRCWRKNTQRNQSWFGIEFGQLLSEL